MEPYKAFFDDMHVTMPVVPKDLVGKIELSEDPAIYDINEYVTQFLQQSPDDYLLVGKANNELHYYVVRGNTALFFQIDTRKSSNFLSGELATVRHLLKSMEGKKADQKIVIYHSDVHGDGWAVVSKDRKPDWQKKKPEDKDKTFLLAVSQELGKIK